MDSTYADLEKVFRKSPSPLTLYPLLHALTQKGGSLSPFLPTLLEYRDDPLITSFIQKTGLGSLLERSDKVPLHELPPPGLALFDYMLYGRRRPTPFARCLGATLPEYPTYEFQHVAITHPLLIEETQTVLDYDIDDDSLFSTFNVFREKINAIIKHDSEFPPNTRRAMNLPFTRDKRRYSLDDYFKLEFVQFIFKDYCEIYKEFITSSGMTSVVINNNIMSHGSGFMTINPFRDLQGEKVLTHSISFTPKPPNYRVKQSILGRLSLDDTFEHHSLSQILADKIEALKKEFQDAKKISEGLQLPLDEDNTLEQALDNYSQKLKKENLQ